MVFLTSSVFHLITLHNTFKDNIFILLEKGPDLVEDVPCCLLGNIHVSGNLNSPSFLT